MAGQKCSAHWREYKQARDNFEFAAKVDQFKKDTVSRKALDRARRRLDAAVRRLMTSAGIKTTGDRDAIVRELVGDP